MTTVQQQ